MIKTDEKNLRNIAGSVLNLIFPEKMYCHCCGDFIDKSRLHGLCDRCIEKIDWNLDNPLAREMEGFYFDNVFTCCTYGFYPRKIIHRLKLYGKNYMAKDIGLLMAERILLEDITAFDLIIPVPMSKKKLKMRGYNQSQLLAEVISEETGIKADYKSLVKKRDTPSMRMASAEQRTFMLDNAFAVANPGAVEGKSILIVDDVVTTGSTANECAKLLKASGAAKVYVLCFSS